ncbi:hypothetical protein SRABI83_00587 [Arthrobacter sp. Bi83]|nr:hypothetical protein SRABI83_00587 [Arthrobacter sp. Bi83]
MVLQQLLDGVLDLALSAAEDIRIIHDVLAGRDGYRIFSPSRCGRKRQHSSQADHGENTFQH